MRILASLALATAAVGCSASEQSASAPLTQEVGNCGSLETHVIGIYRAPEGKATVHIARPGKHALVVSAHDATAWKITAAAGVTIEGVYAVGIEPQRVEAPAGVKVATDSREDGGPGACGWMWNETNGECNTEALIDLTTHQVHDITSYHGCYDASSFTMSRDMGVLSDCGVEDKRSDFVQNCEGEDSCGGDVGPVFL